MPLISVSALYDKDEQDVVDVLIHEMIHYYLWHMKIKDDAPHGSRFTEMMRRINREYGRNITVSIRTSDEVAQTASDRRCYPLIVCTMSNGRRYILVPAFTRFADIVRQLRVTPAVSVADIYISSDSRLSRYPRVRTLKLFNIAPDTLEEITATAIQVKNLKAQA